MKRCWMKPACQVRLVERLFWYIIGVVQLMWRRMPSWNVKQCVETIASLHRPIALC